MLLRLCERVAWAALFVVAAWVVTLFLGGCATQPDRLPCEPGTCSIDQLLEQTRDPFPAEPISYGTIFGPQPQPGTVTVEPPK